MRTFLLAVVILGCGGTETLGTTSQAVLPPGGPTPTDVYECFCTSTGTLSGTLLCVDGAWQCEPDDSGDLGWALQCNGGMGSEIFKLDQNGNKCTGNAYSDFPGSCPELTNAEMDGRWYCPASPLNQ